MQLIIVTGLSGSGKSIAIRELEDCGYYCIDNLPADFLFAVCQHLASSGRSEVAVAIDARTDGSDSQKATGHIRECEQAGIDVRTLFLTASTASLVQRFSETRRRHPLTSQGPDQPERTVEEAIEEERRRLSGLQQRAHTIDTSGVKPAVLRDWVRAFAKGSSNTLTLTFESFAFKSGVPADADLVFDVRNLPNPYWDPQLRRYTGLDKPVIDFLKAQPDVHRMASDIASFIRTWLPSWQNSGKHYLTVAIGCTGGQHRSVYITQALGEQFRGQFRDTIIRHRMLPASH